MKVLILAGGFATRLWPLTERHAKPLLPVAGKPIISHLVEKIPHEYEIIISTNQVFEEEFMEWKKDFVNRKIEIFVEDSGSDDFKKGALGATAFVIQEKEISEDLMLLAGDNIFGFSFEKFLESYKEEPLIAVFDVKDLSEASKYGVVVVKDSFVEKFQEKPKEPESTLVSTGCYVFPANTLCDISHYAKQKHDDLGGIFEYMIEKGRAVRVFSFDEYWYDIGSFSAYIQAHKDLQKGVIKERGVKEMGENQYLGGVWIDRDSIIENSTIENSLILHGCKLTDCVIRDCIIAEECDLNGIDLQGKIIRKGTVIEG